MIPSFSSCAYFRRRLSHGACPVALLLVAWLCSQEPVHSADIQAQWLNGTGNWDDQTQWSTDPAFPLNNGGHTYAATIAAGTAILNRDITINQFTLSYNPPPTNPPPNAALQGTNTLTLATGFNWNGGSITGSGTINSSGTTTISGTSNSIAGWNLNLAGSTDLLGTVTTGTAATINNLSGATFQMETGSSLSGTSGNLSAFNNNGTLKVNATITSTGLANISTATFVNNGNVSVDAGTLQVTSTVSGSGAFTVGSGNRLNFLGSGGTLGAGSSISGAGDVTFQGGSLTLNGAYNASGTAIFFNGNTTFGASSTFTSSSTRFTSATVNFAGTTNITQATTTFSGTVNVSGNVQNLGTLVNINDQFANLNMNVPFTFTNLKLTQGTLAGTGDVTASTSLEWNAGSMQGSGTMTALNGVFFNGTNNTFGSLNRSLLVYGNSPLVQTTSPYSGTLNFGASAAMVIEPGATFNGSRFSIQGSSTVGQTLGAFTNHGSLTIDNPGVNLGMSVFGSAFTNDGTITINNSLLDLRATSNQSIFNQNGGSIVLNNGNFNVSQTTFNINGGSFTGYGTVGGQLYNNGLLSPVGGNLNFYQSPLTLGPTSDLAFTLGGNQAGVTYDQLTNLAGVTLDGDLLLSFANGYQFGINPTDTFTLVSSSATLQGQFDNVSSGGRVQTADGFGSFQVDYSGKNVVLSNFQSAVPEPGGCSLAILGSLVFGFGRKRRKSENLGHRS